MVSGSPLVIDLAIDQIPGFLSSSGIPVLRGFLLFEWDVKKNMTEEEGRGGEEQLTYFVWIKEGVLDFKNGIFSKLTDIDINEATY